MTFEERLRELLTEHGMWNRQAQQAVIDRIKADEAHEAMNEHWGQRVENYPPQMLAVLWLHTKMEALAYIDEVCPKASFRPMFAEG